MSEHKGLRAKVEGRGRILAAAGAVAAALALVAGGAVADLPGVGQVTSQDIHDGQVRSNDIKNGGVYGGPDIHNGTIGVPDLRDSLRSQLGAPDGVAFAGEDDVVELAAGTRADVAALDLSGPHVVVAHATVSSSVADDNLLCWLVDDAGTDIAAGNARASRESFTLTALVSGPVSFQCRTSDGDGTATDIAVTAVEVTLP